VILGGKSFLALQIITLRLQVILILNTNEAGAFENERNVFAFELINSF